MGWLKFSRVNILLTTGSPSSKIITNGLFANLFAVRPRATGENNLATHSVADHMEIVNLSKSRNGKFASCPLREHTMGSHN
jgi:hypothetical protein